MTREPPPRVGSARARVDFTPPPRRRTTLLRVAGAVKWVAIAVGFAASVVALASLVGGLFEEVWLHLAVGVVVALGVPSLVADRLLPRPPVDAPGATRGAWTEEARGRLGDVFAIGLLGFATAFVAAGPSAGLLVREGDRFAGAGLGAVARVAYVLAGATATSGGGAADEAAANGARAGASASEAKGAASPAASGAGNAGDDAKPADRPAIDLVPRGAPDGGKGRADVAAVDALRALGASIVTIDGRGPRGAIGGSGVVVDDRGTIATARAAVDGATALRVRLPSGRVATGADVDLVADDPESQIALLRVHAHDGLRAAPLGDADGVGAGEPVVAIGDPVGVAPTLAEAVVVGRRAAFGGALLALSIPIGTATAGGALVDRRGVVLGITTPSTDTGARAGGTAATGPVIARLLAQARARGGPPRPFDVLDVPPFRAPPAPPVGGDR